MDAMDEELMDATIEDWIEPRMASETKQKYH